MELKDCVPGMLVKVNKNHVLYEQLLHYVGKIEALHINSDIILAEVSFPNVRGYVSVCSLGTLNDFYPVNEKEAGRCEDIW
jgi:hypothetical protein